MNNVIVLYHGGCRDGFCAAWVVNKYIQLQNKNRNDNITGNENDSKINATFIPAYYGKEPPDTKGKDVIIVDFSYDKDTMWNIAQHAESFIWLDHHKTAEPVYEVFSNHRGFRDAHFVFDNTRSGAGIAWDYFFPKEERPWIVNYVEDRDLWLKKLPGTDYINAFIACLEFNFRTWDGWSEYPVSDIEMYGQTAMMKTDQYVREVCKNVYYADIIQSNDRDQWGQLSSYEFPKEHFEWHKEVPIVNIAQVDCSEALHKLCELHPESPFSLYWFKRQDGLYQYGIRSIGNFDCSIVAKSFGGGGHKNAAGFQLPYLLEELK